MTIKDPLSRGYNYYPKTTIKLCVASYLDIGDISATVSGNTDLTVVWGPAQLTSLLGISYSLMYVAKHATTNEYFVVIRGTQADSLTSWLEDFEIATAEEFSALLPSVTNIPSAPIAKGSFKGMEDLLSLTDPTTGSSASDFLQQEGPAYLYVTGHSLGGTLAPVMFAYLNYYLYGGGAVTNMGLFSYAGLTPGGSGFNSMLTAMKPNQMWRGYNTLDIAPFLWWSKSGAEDVYTPYNLACGDLEKDILKHLFDSAAKAGIGYAQPGFDNPIAGDFYLNEQDSYAEQAMYQHHATTYQSLIDAPPPKAPS